MAPKQRQVVERVDASNDRIVTSIPIKSVPGREWGGGDMAVTPGAIWIGGITCSSDRCSGAILQRVDVSTNKLETTRLPGRGVVDLAPDSRGLWALLSTRDPGENEILLIDPRTSRVIERTLFAPSGWGASFPLRARSGSLSAVSTARAWAGGSSPRSIPNTGRALATVRTGGSFTEPVAGTGILWAAKSPTTFALSSGGLGLARIDPAIGRVTSETPVGTIGYDMAAAPDGAVWFLSSRGERASVDRFNPSTGRVDERVKVGGTPIALAASSSSVWVLTYRATLVKIDLR